jgi:predicted nucleic acid-binding protein
MDANDRYHAQSFELINETRERRVIPAAVLPEIDHLARRSLGADAFLDLVREIRRGVYQVEDLLPADYDRVQELLEDYRDLRVGFVDAAVLAIVERLGETKLATLDHRHFAVMKPRHIASLELRPAL